MVTFLFTDIEGSTRLWDTFADDMQRALTIHNGLVSGVVANHSGHIVKNTGDGLLVVFDSASAALVAAVEAGFRFLAAEQTE
jgi:class 3 adenylate cyclase